MTFEQRLDLLLFQVKEMLLKKNADYGNSFEEQFKEYGLISYLIRDDDKTRRLKNLLNNKNQVNESIKDSVLDKAGYALLGLMCLTHQDDEFKALEAPNVEREDVKMVKVGQFNVPESWIVKGTCVKKPPYADLDDE